MWLGVKEREIRERPAQFRNTSQLISHLYPCLQSLCSLFFWFYWSARTDNQFPLEVLERWTSQGTPPRNKQNHWGRRTADMLAALKNTESHHNDVKIKSGVIGLDVLCRQMRWGHLSVPGILHNLAFSNKKKVEECLSKRCIIRFETLVGEKKKPQTIHGLEQCLPMVFGANVASTMRRISSSGEFTTGCCKNIWHFYNTLQFLPLFCISFTC